MTRILAAVLACAALTGAAQAQQTAAERVAWNKPLQPYRAIGPVYDVGVQGIDVFLIETPKGLILLDAGLPESAPLVERSIEALGFHLDQVKILLNSHAHYDHAGGLAQLKRATGAAMVASSPDRPTLESGRVDYGPSSDTPYPPVHVDREIRDGDTVELGGVVLTAHLTPGHTRGCTSWTLPVVEDGVRHEVVFVCSLSVAGNPLAGDKAYPRMADDYRASFAKLGALKADVLLGPHPGFFDRDAKLGRRKPGAPNPFVDPNELRAFVAESQAAFETEFTRQQQAAKEARP